MSKRNTKKAKNPIREKGSRFNKKAATFVIGLVAVLLVLAGVFGFVSVELGTTDYLAFIKNIKLGLDLEGGVYAVYECQRPADQEYTDDEFKAAVDGTAKTLEDLLFSKGFPEAQVSTSGNQIRVEVPSVNDQDDIFALIGRPATLEMYETDTEGKKVDNTAKPLISGKDVKSASVGQDENGKYIIALKFNKDGTKKFADATTKLQGKNMGIFINKELLMNPKVEAVISNGEASITGDYTYEQANETAVKIQSGAMAIPLNLLESDTISPTLGSTSTRDGLIAGGVGLLLIMAFMIWRYRMMGVAASISLLFFTATYLFFLSIFPWVQLTLPGIAGILLSMGMAVDANVIIFERIKELRQGRMKKLASCVDEGFKNSYSAILDGNVTTLIGAIVLIILPTAASIKGFAITLLIGIIISLISALFFTKLMIKSMFVLTDVTDKDTEDGADKLNKLYGTGGDSIDYTIYDDDEIAEVTSDTQATKTEGAAV